MAKRRAIRNKTPTTEEATNNLSQPSEKTEKAKDSPTLSINEILVGLFIIVAVGILFIAVKFPELNPFFKLPSPTVEPASVSSVEKGTVLGLLDISYSETADRNFLILSNLTEVRKVCSCDGCYGCVNKYAIGQPKN